MASADVISSQKRSVHFDDKSMIGSLDPSSMYTPTGASQPLMTGDSLPEWARQQAEERQTSRPVTSPLELSASLKEMKTNDSLPIWAKDQYGPADLVTTQGVDLALHGNVGPDQGVNTVGFRRAKYTPAEWHESNYAKYYQAFGDRDQAEQIRHEADRTVKETEESSYRPQLKSTQLLKERLHDILFWKHELEREINDIIEETDLLVAQKRRLENALRATEVPLHIATDNLNVRRRRQGVDLVQDDVELNLLKEIEVINNVQDLLRKTIAEAANQIASNRDAKRKLEMDWSDKKEAEEFDSKAANLRNHLTNKQYHAGAATFQQVQSTPESWAQFTHDNIANAEHERMGSIQLRTLIDNVLEDTSRDMREQYDVVNVTFHKRISQVEDAKQKLQENLEHVVNDIDKQENLIKHLKKELFAKEDNLKVAQSRLHLRQNRPNVELCRDDPHYHLVGEVHELQQNVDQLLQRINEATKNLKQLTDDRMQLEREISNKKNTIFLDREKCLTHRNRYPTTIRLQGYNQD